MPNDNQQTTTVAEEYSEMWIKGWNAAMEEAALFIEDEGPVTHGAERCAWADKDYADAIRRFKRIP